MADPPSLNPSHERPRTPGAVPWGPRAPAAAGSAPVAAGGWIWVIALLAGLLGFWVVQQWRLQTLLQQTAAARETGMLTQLVQSSLARDAVLAARLSTLRHDAASAPSTPVAGIRHRLRAVQGSAGLGSVAGVGVTVVLHDAASPSFPGEPAELQLVHDQYVLHIVGLLSAAGAQAISIAGQRYVSTTAIYCAGPTISVNGVTSGSPFVIQAVGRPTALLGALANDPDVQGWSQLVSIQFHAAAAVRVAALPTVPDLPWLTPAGHRG